MVSEATHFALGFGYSRQRIPDAGFSTRVEGHNICGQIKPFPSQEAARDAYPPIQGMYTATKHAVKGYTDCLRVEIEDVDKAPVAVTLIQPTAVDTPFPQHARNFTDKETMLPKPTIEPKDVADAILDAAETPTRAKTVGTMSLINTTVSKLLPSMADKMAAKQVGRMHYDEPPRNPAGAIHRPSEAVGVAGQTHGSGGREPK